MCLPVVTIRWCDADGVEYERTTSSYFEAVALAGWIDKRLDMLLISHNVRSLGDDLRRLRDASPEGV